MPIEEVNPTAPGKQSADVPGSATLRPALGREAFPLRVRQCLAALRQKHQVRPVRRAYDGVARFAAYDLAPHEGNPHAAPHSRRASVTAELAFSL